MIDLRFYQSDLVTSIRQAYSDGFRAPLVVLPTGGGKTTIFAYVTSSAASKGKCVFLIAHRAELVKQIAMTLARFDCTHRVIAPTAIVRQVKAEQFRSFNRSFVDGRAKVYVCSVQTLVKHLPGKAKPGEEITDVPDIIVIDEAHHLTPESQWGAVAAAYPDAYLLPVTATPIRLDGKGLGVEAGSFADTIVPGPTMDWLISEGFLSDYVVVAPPNTLVERLRKISTSKAKGDYVKKALAEETARAKITGDAVKTYLERTPGKRAIAFCVSIEEAENAAQEFNDAGVPASVLDGTLDPGERDRRIKAFEAGELLVLASCDVVSEGFDLPAIEVAILLRATKSLSLFLQQVGRALRAIYAKGFDLDTREGRLAAIAAGTKPIAYIHDHVGAIATHGLPDEYRGWSLDGRVRRAANDNGPATAIQTCPMCFTIHRPAALCPSCGHVYTVAERTRSLDRVEGELVEITAAERAAMKARAEAEKKTVAIKRKREERDCETLDDLIQLGQSRGYQFPKQWALKILAMREKYRRASA